jgi:phosphoglycolate phosphatase-like HAD superfamily hydrolase
MRLLVSLCLCGIAAVLALPVPDCASFNPNSIKLVTFDVFAALMDTPNSLVSTVTPLLQSYGVPSDKAAQFVEGMIDGYSNYADHTFTLAETGGMEPFQYVANTSLVSLLRQFHVPIAVDSPPFLHLLACWGRLKPWSGVASTVAAVFRAGIQVAPLSNGAAFVLRQAWAGAFPDIPLPTAAGGVFSSDWPVGAFKPQPVMYHQLLSITGLDASQVLHVAGAPIDAQGGRQAGLYTALSWNAPLPGLQPCFALSNITQLLQVLHV